MNGNTKDYVLPLDIRRYVRDVIGPCRCQGCGKPVIAQRLGLLRLGWLHPDGAYRCKPGPK